MRNGGKPWTPEQEKRLRQLYPVTDTAVLAKQFRRTVVAVKTRAKRLGIKTKGRSRTSWTPDMIKKMIKLFPSTLNCEIAQKLGLSESAVEAKAFKLGLRKTDEFRFFLASKTMFRRGQVPVNKGKKMPSEVYRRCKASMFKKGNLPHNTKHDGALAIRWRGSRPCEKPHWYIRLSLGKWQELQRFNWEQHNGPIPKGMCLWCLDGDTLNIHPSNWELITMAENIRRNSGSLRLADGYVAYTICGKNHMDLFPMVRQNKKLIEAKRQLLTLKRAIHENRNNGSCGHSN